MLKKLLPSVKLVIYILCGFISNKSIAQKNCHVQSFNEQIQQLKQKGETHEEFEKWITSKGVLKTNSIGNTANRLNQAKAAPYLIPVVFHILHNGESIGSGANVSMDRILFQIKSMNEDYRRKNEDANKTPSDFTKIAADANIEFVLAKRDPDGLPTTGVVRNVSQKNKYSLSDAPIISSQSYWPAEEYLNIWVINITGAIGFAKYPVSDLTGLFEKNLDRAVDGVYIDHHYLGNNTVKLETRDYISTGRTVTHEIGHWLGLRHIWGDGPCGYDDYCEDTPTQEGPIYGCPVFGEEVSCGSKDMFQNYMDYSDDICMNLFTKCQVRRMRTVLENSPRRKSLLTSPALNEPDQFANDLGIRKIISPLFGQCDQIITPSIEVLNYGTNRINSFQIEVLVNDISSEVLSFTKNLNSFESTSISFSELNTENIENGVTFKIKSVNETIDGNPSNDCQWINSVFPVLSTLPILENFEKPRDQILNLWHSRNHESNSPQWEIVNAIDFEVNNKAIRFNNFKSTQYGQLDYLMSPVFNLTGVVTVDLKFRYAYAPFFQKYMDALQIVVSTDCGATFPHENTIWESWSPELATTSYTDKEFLTEGPGSWRNVEINFGEFSNEENVVIAFVGNHGGGNHMYIDQIEISTNNVANYDLSLRSINQIPPVTCNNGLIPTLEIKNLGLVVINSFDVVYSVDDQTKTVQETGFSILPGKTVHVPLSLESLEIGTQLLSVTIQNPNGRPDENTTNSTQSKGFEVKQTKDELPYLEKFTNPSSSQKWSYINQDGEDNWDIYNWHDNDKCAMVKGFGNLNYNVKNWLISPTLDFSNVDKASMTFDVSYAYLEGRNDQMQIFVSTNCGQSYDQLIYDESGSQLSTSISTGQWFPTKLEDWKRTYLDLSDYVGEKSIRIAFVITNQNGNNMFLDNIEFYDILDPVEIKSTKTIAVFPIPFSTSNDSEINIKFSFNIKEEVSIRLVNLSGKVLIEKSFPNTLNQLYKIENIQIQSGVYLLHVLGASTNLTEKIIITD